MKFQMISKFEDAVFIDNENIVDEIIQEFELGIDTYTDGSLSKKVLENAKILDRFIGDTRETEIFYQECSRSLTEFKGGYKIALQRGTKLNEVNVFNFPPLRLRNKMIDSITNNPLAQIYPYGEERWILLHPVDTEMMIDYETTSYMYTIKKYVNQGRISQGSYDELIENLQLININERCAQTLIHEYGHILHWKKFDLIFSDFKEKLGVSAKQYHIACNALILAWFEESNYLYNVSSRYPGFKNNKSIPEKVTILKESFVEDYRIGLNMKSINGKMILPNSQCVFGDLMEPELMIEGVAIVKKMINEIETQFSSYEMKSHENEYDRINSLFELDDQIESTDWKPRADTLTRFEGKRLVDQALKDAKIDCLEQTLACLR